MRQSEKGTIVDIKQASAPTSSPVPSAVMSLLKTPPTVYIQAAPSWLANGKARPPLPVASKQLQQPVKKAVIVKKQTSPMTSPPAIPAKPALPKHVPLQGQSPISSEIMGKERQGHNVNKITKTLLTPCSPEIHVAFMPQTPTPPTPPRHLHNKSASATAAEHYGYDVVNEEEERADMRSPGDAEAAALPVHPPINAIAPCHPLSSTMLKKQAEKKAISKGQMSYTPCPHTLPAAHVPAKHAPTPPSRAVPRRLTSKEIRPHVEEVATRRKPSVVDGEREASVKTHRMIEARSRVPPKGPLHRKVPPARKQEELLRAVEDTTGQGLANGQAQAQSSIPLGKMGEERRSYPVVSKLIRAPLMARSPEISAVLTPPIPPSPPPPLFPRRSFDEFSWTPITKQCDDIVISKNEEADASKHMPEARTAPTLPALPARFPAPPTQTSAPCQSLDSSLPPAEVQPRQDGLCAINLRYSPNDTRLPTLRTARKQSEPFKTPPREREGVYLERAAAYV